MKQAMRQAEHLAEERRRQSLGPRVTAVEKDQHAIHYRVEEGIQ